MPGAIIVINQPTGAGAGTADVARDDIWAGQAVHLEVGTAGNSSIQWELLDVPPGSAATIANASQSGGGPYAPGIITPDLRGTYRVSLSTNGGGPGNTSIKVFRVRFDNTGALLERGWAFPAFGEQPSENNTVSSAGRSYVRVLSDIIEDALTVVLAAAGDPLMTPGVIMARDGSGNTAVETLYAGEITSVAGLGRADSDLLLTAADDMYLSTGTGTRYTQHAGTTVATEQFALPGGYTTTFATALTALTYTFAAAAAGVGAPVTYEGQAGGGANPGTTYTFETGVGTSVSGDFIVDVGTPGTGTPSPIGGTRLTGMFRVAAGAAGDILRVFRGHTEATGLGVQVLGGAAHIAMPAGSMLAADGFLLSANSAGTVVTNLHEAPVGTFRMSPNAPFLLQPATVASGVGRAATFAAGAGAPGSVGGLTTIGANNGGTPGTNAAGGVVIQLGQEVAGVSSVLNVKADTTNILAVGTGASDFLTLGSAKANCMFRMTGAGSFTFASFSGQLSAYAIYSNAFTWTSAGGNFNLTFPNVPAVINQLSTTQLQFRVSASTGAAGKELILAGGNGSAGFAGGKTTIGADNGGTPGTDLGGGVDLQIGARVGSTSGLLRVLAGADMMLSVERYATSYARILTGASVPNFILATGSGTINLESYSTLALRNAGAGAVGGVVVHSDRFRRTDAGTANAFVEDLVRRVPSITTATTTTVATFPTATGMAYEVTGIIVVANATDNESASFRIAALFQNIAGVLTQVGPTQPLTPPAAGPNQLGLSAQFTISTTNILLELVSDSTDTLRANGTLTALPCAFAA